MVYIDESKLAAYRNTIRDHKRELKFADAHEASISRRPNGLSLEAEQVLAQVGESIFCVADLDNPCDCPSCKQYEAESRADALATYVPNEDEECHDDHEINECFECLENAIGKAEDAYDAMIDEEMGL